MIGLLPLGRVITFIATIYSAITGLILWASYDDSTNFASALSIAFGGSTALHIVLLASFYLGWPKVWRMFPKLNTILFPDLNGSWEMRIEWERNDDHGTSIATAVIKQSFLKVSMDVDAEDSESQTLLAVPKKDPESGRPLLYYMFLVTPKNRVGFKNAGPYRGAAILKLGMDNSDVLEGNYFTSQKYVGHYVLKRIET